MDVKELKQLGNDAFRQSKWEEAAGHYTAALQLDSSLEAAAALFSNRCACYCSLFRFDLALLDANATVRLRPTWSKGYARRAEAFVPLQAFDRAHQSYVDAFRRAEDDAARNRYASAAQTYAAKAQSAHARATATLQEGIDNPGVNWKVQADEQIATGTPPWPLSIVETALWAFGECSRGMRLLDTTFTKSPAGVLQGSADSPLIPITSCILTESTRGMHLVVGNNRTYLIHNKLTDVIKFDYGFHQYSQFMVEVRDASEVIEYFDGRKIADGPRKALSAMLSGLIVAGFLQCSQANIGPGLIHFRFASEIIKAGITKWAPAPAELATTCGDCFSPTFARGVNVQVLIYLEQGFLRAKTDVAKAAFSLDEVDRRAKELLEDLAANPIGPEAGVQHTTFQLIPTTVANKSCGIVAYTKSIHPNNMFKHGPLKFFHIKLSATAGRFYLDAARALPEDSPDRAMCLYRALALLLRGGGLTIREAFARGAEAEQAMAPPEKIFGPSPRTYEDREFARIQLGAMRDWIESGAGNVLAYTDAAGVPIPDPLDITLQPIATVSAKDLPPSGNPMDKCEEAFLKNLPGHISLVDVHG